MQVSAEQYKASLPPAIADEYLKASCSSRIPGITWESHWRPACSYLIQSLQLGRSLSRGMLPLGNQFRLSTCLKQSDEKLWK